MAKIKNLQSKHKARIATSRSSRLVKKESRARFVTVRTSSVHFFFPLSKRRIQFTSSRTVGLHRPHLGVTQTTKHSNKYPQLLLVFSIVIFPGTRIFCQLNKQSRSKKLNSTTDLLHVLTSKKLVEKERKFFFSLSQTRIIQERGLAIFQQNRRSKAQPKPPFLNSPHFKPITILELLTLSRVQKEK
jgi:hypothetical protein